MVKAIVRESKPIKIEEGDYDAELLLIYKETKYDMDRSGVKTTEPLWRWVFKIKGQDGLKLGTLEGRSNCNLDLNPNSKAYRWAKAILGKEIEADMIYNLEDLNRILAHKPCRVHVKNKKKEETSNEKNKKILNGRRYEKTYSIVHDVLPPNN